MKNTRPLRLKTKRSLHVTCGDNCAPWILKIAKTRDITINLHHIMDFGDGEFEIEILNCGKMVHNMAELAMIAGLYL